MLGLAAIVQPQRTPRNIHPGPVRGKRFFAARQRRSATRARPFYFCLHARRAESARFPSPDSRGLCATRRLLALAFVEVRTAEFIIRQGWRSRRYGRSALKLCLPTPRVARGRRQAASKVPRRSAREALPRYAFCQKTLALIRNARKTYELAAKNVRRRCRPRGSNHDYCRSTDLSERIMPHGCAKATPKRVV